MKLQDLSEDVLALGGATSEVKMEAGFRIYGQFYVKYESAEVRRHSRVQSTVVVHYQKMENVLLRILNTTSYQGLQYRYRIPKTGIEFNTEYWY